MEVHLYHRPEFALIVLACSSPDITSKSPLLKEVVFSGKTQSLEGAWFILFVERWEFSLFYNYYLFYLCGEVCTKIIVFWLRLKKLSDLENCENAGKATVSTVIKCSFQE